MCAGIVFCELRREGVNLWVGRMTDSSDKLLALSVIDSYGTNQGVFSASTVGIPSVRAPQARGIARNLRRDIFDPP